MCSGSDTTVLGAQAQFPPLVHRSFNKALPKEQAPAPEDLERVGPLPSCPEALTQVGTVWASWHRRAGWGRCLRRRSLLRPISEGPCLAQVHLSLEALEQGPSCLFWLLGALGVLGWWPPPSSLCLSSRGLHLCVCICLMKTSVSVRRAHPNPG